MNSAIEHLEDMDRESKVVRLRRKHRGIRGRRQALEIADAGYLHELKHSEAIWPGAAHAVLCVTSESVKLYECLDGIHARTRRNLAALLPVEYALE